MESHFPRCVHCLAPMQSSGITETLKSLLRRPVTCSACGKKVLMSEAQVMGETFGACVVRFHHQLHQAVVCGTATGCSRGDACAGYIRGFA